ncbi:UPF0729 protein GD16342 [Condylostylus longicornis]|uniref:UPF0729 protein GD16342 n=1 Tax=Condylostylus longicornis TaxID=2530218 RepID=UPI00244DD68F|nr:UPF0729 protein GD16342 [Condylostylus longicornis]
MVCVPCFIIPVLLFIWHKFIQPIVLRYWNPWEKKDADGNVIKAGPEFPFQCNGDQCTFLPKKKEICDNTSDKLDPSKPKVKAEDQKKCD